MRARVAVEAGTTLRLEQSTSDRTDGIVGHDDFGASAPIKDLLKHFGFTVDNVVAKAREVMKKVTRGQHDVAVHAAVFAGGGFKRSCPLTIIRFGRSCSVKRFLLSSATTQSGLQEARLRTPLRCALPATVISIGI